MDIKDKIIVKDNFFKSETLEKIQNQLSAINFTNRFNDQKNTIYQKIYFYQNIDKNHFALKEMHDNLKTYDLKYNPDKTESSYFLSTKHKDPTPHNDDNYFNCLIYLKGEHLVNSGTGFYDVVPSNRAVINTHVGFKENRAIIFDAKLYHASLQFSENTATRYAMANFCYE